jgi:hypothetical protein
LNSISCIWLELGRKRNRNIEESLKPKTTQPKPDPAWAQAPQRPIPQPNSSALGPTSLTPLGPLPLPPRAAQSGLPPSSLSPGPVPPSPRAALPSALLSPQARLIPLTSWPHWPEPSSSSAQDPRRDAASLFRAEARCPLPCGPAPLRARPRSTAQPSERLSLLEVSPTRAGSSQSRERAISCRDPFSPRRVPPRSPGLACVEDHGLPL